MSYGGQSNAPWQRNVMQGHQQSGGYHQGSQMYMQNAQQNNMAAFGHGGMQGGNSSNMFPGGSGGGNSISYPQPRSGLNPVAFQQGGSSQSHYNSIGTVTKISNDCGLVNDEVFFYRNVCKGPEPILGDRVIFEASYSNNGQFKWNATRIQLMQQPQPLIGSNKGNYSSVAPPNEYQRGQMRRNSPKRSPIRGHDRERERLHRSRDRDEIEHERKRRREDTDRSRDRGVVSNNRGGAEARGHPPRNDKDRDRVETRKKEREVADREREEREKEINRALEAHRASAKDRRARNRKRYMVKIPKSLLTIKTADLHDLRQRYTALYIPSDFFLSNVKWPESFAPDNPFSLRRPCHFHIMHETVESPTEQNPDLLEPADASYLYSAKVMLLSLPPIAEIYKRCFESDDTDDHGFLHPSRLINFLVGVKGGVGTMAIGGPWSPSLDGENPDKDPSVLIRTAIRTCKALTGIDLSNCTQWYRFVELYYHRTEYKNMEKDGPPRVETVVIYLPDVHSCIPSIEEWQTLTQIYKSAADDVIARRSAAVAAAAAEANNEDDNDKTNDVEMAEDSTTLADDTAGENAEENPTDNDEQFADNEEDDDGQNIEEEDEEMEDSTASADISGAADDAGDAEEPADDQTTANDENDEPAPEPTHYSLLDLRTMKVQEIRDELLARNLPDKGVRNVVMARLAKALNTEKSEESRNRRIKNLSTIANKKPNETNNKEKKDEEQREVDSETSSKAVAKKTVDEMKKKSEKKGTVENNANGKGKSSKTPSGKKDKNVKEDKEDWADMIDFELSDIVVLDEYDSSKNAEETNLTEMTEKEKARLIRFYTLPSSPQIIVHPNRQAKAGKFDCAIKSLSVLLDYHPDDNKERFFEVSLFAELFNDMLMRDFGFNIYKEIYLYKESANECEATEADTKTDKSETDAEAKKDTKEKDEEKEKSSKKDKSVKDQRPEDSHSNKSESRKRKISTSASTVNGKDHELTASDKKTVVVKPQLLLSFVYFDITHCGYIFEKDLEDLFSVLGLNLSRSQIKKVLGTCKLNKYGDILYRDLTDKEESLESIPAIEDVDDIDIEELKRIAAGNNQYESVFGRKTAHGLINDIGDDENNEGLTNYNGTIVHVGKLLNQINRTEKNYSDLEKLHNDLIKQHNDLQKEHNKSSTKIKDLQAEIKSVSRKLIEANQDYYSLNRKYRDQNATLSYIYTRVAPYFVREKDEKRDGKSEGPREKEKENKDKEKEKSKDKECEKEKSKDDKDKTVKKEDNKNKENLKDSNEKEVVKEDKEKVKDEKEKVKDDKDKLKGDSENVKDEKEKVKDDKEKLKSDKENGEDEKEKVKENEKEKAKAKAKSDKEKEQEKVKVKEEKEKEPTKNDKEKEKPKIDKEKEQPKNDKEKEKPKTNKEKEKPKNDKEKEKPKDDKQKDKPKEVKEKPIVKTIPSKNVAEKPKPLTPAAKKQTLPVVKVVKKADIGIKK